MELGDPGSTLNPLLAVALVKAQASVQGVQFDGWNNHQNYKYATTGAVLDCARKAFAAGGLAMLRIAEKMVPCEGQFGRPENCAAPYATLHVEYMLIHGESGAWLMVRGSMAVQPGKGRPVDKAKCIAYTTLEKYLRAGILGIDWGDRGADMDQRPDHPSQQKPKQGQDPQDSGHPNEPPKVAERRTVSQEPAPSPSTNGNGPSEHENPKLRHALQEVRRIFANSRIETERFWTIATGLSQMPGKAEALTLAGHLLLACRQAATNIEKCDEANCGPDKWTHEAYIQTCMKNGFDFAMINGSPTTGGVEYDNAMKANSDA